MIFALDETGEISVLSGLAEVRRDCEAIDVETGVWKFFDENGHLLRPVFTQPNKVRKLLGTVSSIEQGEFSLEPADPGPNPTLLEAINSNSVYLNNASRFPSIDSLRSYLMSRSGHASI